MPPRRTGPRPGVFGTPSIRTGGLGVLQVEALNNRPMSIARRHYAASQLRMRTIEPDELSSSEWVRFLVMEEHERERWITQFERRRRRGSDESASSSAEADAAGVDKEAEARQEADRASPEARVGVVAEASRSSSPVGSTPTVSVWARLFDDEPDATQPVPRRPRHARRATASTAVDAPPTYETAVRSRTPPPAYAPRSDDEGPALRPRRIRFAV